MRTSASCSAAHAYLRKCAWGSSADVGFAEIVRSRCEKDFIQILSATQKIIYADKSSLCADEFANQDGTLALSEQSTCFADIAFQFATNLTEASRPLPRASFDCVKAKSPLEITICVHPDLGRQDLLMARAYFPFFKAIKGSDRKTLLDNQRAWNERIPTACRLSGVPASPAVVSCLIQKYKARTSVLDACGNGLDIACITNDDTSRQP
ncbi:lysozyme inhibitor LprI family protein [Edaphobacter sp. HDX4]|uniref:lysozyme inhibitor LprI family protein n=1 Tax=Edaphobacter sp. HDX4 TaxID=2794064 RepID=UPI002FE68BCB